MQVRLLDRARSVAAFHHDLARQELGTDVLGVWLVGSAMLSDLTAKSDIDTVTLTTHPVQPEEHDAIARAHGSLGHAFPGVRHDTTYLSLAALALPPEEGLVTPFSQDGRLRFDQPCGQVHPITWFTLPQAIPVAGGIAPGSVRIHADRAAATEYSVRNLQTYWADVAFSVREQASGRGADEELSRSDTVVWMVLGAPRLAAFLAGMQTRGPVPSKSEAGRWVVRRIPRHAELARRALRVRAGRPEPFTVRDAREAADLVMLLVHGHG